MHKNANHTLQTWCFQALVSSNMPFFLPIQYKGCFPWRPSHKASLLSLWFGLRGVTGDVFVEALHALCARRGWRTSGRNRAEVVFIPSCLYRKGIKRILLTEDYHIIFYLDDLKRQTNKKQKQTKNHLSVKREIVLNCLLRLYFFINTYIPPPKMSTDFCFLTF